MDDSVVILQDIIEPLAPLLAASPPYWQYGSYVLLVLVVLGLIALLRWRWRVYRSQAPLHKLRLELAAGRIDPHQAIYMLAAETRRIFHLKRLSVTVVPKKLSELPAADDAWRNFASRLDVWRYQSPTTNKPDDQDIVALFDQALLWAKRYPC